MKTSLRGPLFSPHCARLSHHSPLHPACPVMSCITCSVVGMSCVRKAVFNLCTVNGGEGPLCVFERH